MLGRDPPWVKRVTEAHHSGVVGPGTQQQKAPHAVYQVWVSKGEPWSWQGAPGLRPDGDSWVLALQQVGKTCMSRTQRFATVWAVFLELMGSPAGPVGVSGWGWGK